MIDILPERINRALLKLNREKIYEIRIRRDKKVMVNYCGKYVPLLENRTNPSSTIHVCKNEMELIIGLASKRSFYAFNEQIRQGYITLEQGIRIGICGEIVADKGKVITIKNINSLNIRFPHEVLGCSDMLFNYIYKNDEVLNTLIISRPGAGKTTMLRDLSRNISKYKNLLIVDEKNEITSTINGESLLNIGENTDVFVNCKKEYGIGIGVKNMCPDVILTDELSTDLELKQLVNCISCGVNIISSIHADNLDNFLLKDIVKYEIVPQKLFDRYVFLSTKNGRYYISSILDRDLNQIYLDQL